MNEIAKQIIELGRLIGKRVFIKHYNFNCSYYNDNEKIEIFMVEDFESYSYGLLNQEIKLVEIRYTEKLDGYYLVIFKDL